MSLRISAISFLNTAPLMWDFVHGKAGADFEISYTVPSACAESLRLGTADIGIIPVVAYNLIPGLRIVPDVCIAANGPVRSILLVSKKPIEEIQTVAADTSSRTSVALARVLFRKWFGGRRQFHAMAPNLRAMLDIADAALIIGDPALTIDRSKYICYDLAEEWHRLTGKSFVFAFWAVREGVQHRDLAHVFRRSRDNGLKHVDEIAAEWAPKVGLSQEEVKVYLTENIDYRLDAAKIEGMELFFRYAVEHGVIASARPLEFLAAADSLPTGKLLQTFAGLSSALAALTSLL